MNTFLVLLFCDVSRLNLLVLRMGNVVVRYVKLIDRCMCPTGEYVYRVEYFFCTRLLKLDVEICLVKNQRQHSVGLTLTVVIVFALELAEFPYQ